MPGYLSCKGVGDLSSHLDIFDTSVFDPGLLIFIAPAAYSIVVYITLPLSQSIPWLLVLISFLGEVHSVTFYT